MKKYSWFMRALCFALCFVLLAAGCKQPDPEVTGSETDPGGEDVSYTVKVVTAGGMPLSDIGVYVYEDDTLAELQAFGRTDADGVMSFTAPAGGSYAAVLQDVPNGYLVEASYPVDSQDAVITLSADTDSDVGLEDLSYKLGDVVYDFSVIDPDGTVYTLSELLQDKKAVVLNFWYTQCDPCKAEFPYLQAAWEQYQDDVAVLAMNPVDGTNEAVAQFAEELGLTLPIMGCDSAWMTAMGVEAYPTTVVIDRYGTICMIHVGSVTDEGVFEAVFEHFAAEDYVQTLITDINELAIVEGGDEDTTGTIDNPKEFGGVTKFELTVEPGQEIYCNLYKASQMVLQIKNSNAYVIYNGKTYRPSSGTVTVYLSEYDSYTPAPIVVGNSGDETMTFTVTLGNLAGSVANPYSLKLGEFTTKLSAGNEQGLYYTYKAKETGTLTLQLQSITSGVECDYVLYNLSSYAYRTLAYDGTTENGVKSVSVPVKAGQTVQVIVSVVPDSAFNYPAATIKTLASFTAGTAEDDTPVVETQTYTITVVDDSNTPVSGAYLSVVVDEKTMMMATDAAGTVNINLPKGSYNVTLTVPGGYTAEITNYLLTEEQPSVTINLVKEVVVMADYSVVVVDETGAPIPNVLVSIGSSYKYTDAQGKAVFNLKQGSYNANISIPEGYTSELGSSFSFLEGATELTVTLQSGAGSGGEDTRITYTVKVTDYEGKALTDVMVKFLQSGTQVDMQTVNSSGTVTAQLAPGGYTVALAFSGGSWYYDAESAVLSSDKTSVTIRVAPVLNTSNPGLINVSGVDHTVYTVGEGVVYSELIAGKINYFEFTPTRAGVYRFSVPGNAATVGYYGSSFFVQSTNVAEDWKDNAFTQTVKDLGPSFIIGLTPNSGAKGAVLSIEWVSEPPVEVPDTPYQAKHTPRKYTFSGGTLTYVDVTGATGDYTLVKGSDGFYHLGSADGPLMLMNLGEKAPYLSIQTMLSGAGAKGYFYENGTLVRKEVYTNCLLDYVSCIDTKTGVYPLTDDLMYIIKTYGKQAGWWSGDSNIFNGLAGVNTEIAWMFACCYVE